MQHKSSTGAVSAWPGIDVGHLDGGFMREVRKVGASGTYAMRLCVAPPAGMIS